MHSYLRSDIAATQHQKDQEIKRLKAIIEELQAAQQAKQQWYVEQLNKKESDYQLRHMELVAWAKGQFEEAVKYADKLKAELTHAKPMANLATQYMQYAETASSKINSMQSIITELKSRLDTLGVELKSVQAAAAQKSHGTQAHEDLQKQNAELAKELSRLRSIAVKSRADAQMTEDDKKRINLLQLQLNEVVGALGVYKRSFNELEKELANLKAAVVSQTIVEASPSKENIQSPAEATPRGTKRRIDFTMYSASANSTTASKRTSVSSVNTGTLTSVQTSAPEKAPKDANFLVLIQAAVAAEEERPQPMHPRNGKK